MKLWLDNRLDGEYELTPEQIAAKFAASPFVDHWREGLRLERCLLAFLSGNEIEGGLHSTFDVREQAEEWDRVLEVTLEALS